MCSSTSSTTHCSWWSWLPQSSSSWLWSSTVESQWRLLNWLSMRTCCAWCWVHRLWCMVCWLRPSCLITLSCANTELSSAVGRSTGNSHLLKAKESMSNDLTKMFDRICLIILKSYHLLLLINWLIYKWVIFAFCWYDLGLIKFIMIHFLEYVC